MKKIVAVLVCASASLLAAQTPQQVMTEARAAYDATNYVLYAEKMEQLSGLRPGHPVVLFNLAGAYALSNRAADACRTLGRVAAMRLAFDANAEKDFDAVRNDKCFAAAAEKLRSARTDRVGGSTLGFTIPINGLITEGIAWDGPSKSFYVSSVRKGVIYRVDERGTASIFFRAPDGVKGLNGLAVDEKHRLLWIAASASERAENFSKEDEGRGALLAVSLSEGSLSRRIDLNPADRLFLDSLAVTDGTVYVSNSRGSVLRLSSGAEQLETFVPAGSLRSPQAPALSADRKRLYVADYAGPIAVVSTADGTVTKMTMPDDFPYIGIDGLTLHGNALYAIQNGVEPNRLSRLQLDATGTRVTSWKILEMNHPLMDEPTLGTVVGNDLYWIARSQGNKFDATPPKLDQLGEAVILKTRMK